MEPQLEKLRVKAVGKVRSFLLHQIETLKEPKTNIQVLQQHVLLKYSKVSPLLYSTPVPLLPSFTLSTPPFSPLPSPLPSPLSLPLSPLPQAYHFLSVHAPAVAQEVRAQYVNAMARIGKTREDKEREDGGVGGRRRGVWGVGEGEEEGVREGWEGAGQENKTKMEKGEGRRG